MVERKVLLNPGPATTTDTVKMAQVVPDICPREKEFVGIMRELEDGLLKIVHADPKDYAAVLFCGSGTINMDICLNSLLPEGKKILVINNGAYSSRGAEICAFYGLDYINLKLPISEQPDLIKVEEVLRENPDIALVYTTHHETGTGLLNPIREIGALAHKYQALFVVDTTSTYAMRPINVYEENIDFCMASAQKGIMGMTGLSYIIGRKDAIEASKDYPTRSYYCNLYLQYSYAKEHGEMHFTPPVQVIYAARQALKEYFAEGETAKWERHQRVYDAITRNLTDLGFKIFIPKEQASGLVAAAMYPEDANWDFGKVHDYCFERGFTIYPGKVEDKGMFRLCALGAIDEKDIEDFFVVFREALQKYNVAIPVKY
ncbi:MAG: 2-aminoethylphosphonate aminotransferase [Lachnospiraceae bacterium]|nr:2-aminoethylphosphonate aminotransferase [Lachnospiraceae bacterium]